MEKKLENYLFRSTLDKDKHIIAKYFVKSKDLLKAAKGIAIGQSILLVTIFKIDTPVELKTSGNSEKLKEVMQKLYKTEK